MRTGDEETQPKEVGRGVKFRSETGNGGMMSGRKTERARSNIMTFDQIRDPQGGYIANGGGITLQQVASTPIHRILLSGSPTISPSTPFRASQQRIHWMSRRTVRQHLMCQGLKRQRICHECIQMETMGRSIYIGGKIDNSKGSSMNFKTRYETQHQCRT